MADLALLRAGLAANLASITGLQQSAYLMASPTPPCAEVQPAEMTFDAAMSRGLDRWTFTVRVLVGATTDIGAQKLLDKFIAGSGTQSVKASLETDPTLGGAADDLRVTTCTGYRIFARDGGGPVLGAEWTVEVLAEGDPT